jgi:hypothetical protein
MIENKIILEKKIPETEKDIVNCTSTYDNLRAETERKDKCWYIHQLVGQYSTWWSTAKMFTLSGRPL